MDTTEPIRIDQPATSSPSINPPSVHADNPVPPVPEATADAPIAATPPTEQAEVQQSHSDQPFFSFNGGPIPVLQTNGFHPPIFHPIIDEAAKKGVAQSLADFLASIHAKNAQSQNNHFV